VIVTASHNPPEFNGIKCIAADGLEASREVEERIEAAFDAGTAPTVPFDRVGELDHDGLGAERYVRGILERVGRERIVARKFHVVLDCGNGASVPTSPTLLQRLGCRTVTLNGHIDGRFPGRRSEPTEANLGDLKGLVPSVGADLGVAHDGDADRAVFVLPDGTYLAGETALAVLARDAVERAGGGVVVVPVSTSLAVEEAVRPFGGRVTYTRIGSPSVTRAMQEQKAVFGGEDNGGLIFPAFQLARDGAMTLAATLDLLARRGGTLGDLAKEVPKYHLLKETVGCPVALRERVLARVAERLARGGARVETLDGVKVYLPTGWLLLRPSGTEPIFRVAAEAKAADDARALSELGLRTVREALAEVGANA
jgi:phosphomannomutase / phosphoglucomutase